MKKGYIIFISSVIVIIILGLMLIYRAFFISNGIKIDKSIYPITGIDISGHTGDIKFDEILKQKIDFVYIKATEGENFVDPKFEVNYTNSSNKKLTIGFYHFFRFNKSGKSQAENFLKNTRNKKDELPPVIDIEEWGNISNKSTKEIVCEIETFISFVEKNTSKKVMIYTNESSYKKYVLGNFDENAIWICSFSKKPNIQKKWTLWQHSHKGKFMGTDGWVDINTFNGNRNEWNKYLKR